MKQLMIVLFSAVSIIAAPSSSVVAADPIASAVMTIPIERYQDSRWVELVVDGTSGRVWLRIPSVGGLGKAELNFMTDKVLEIVSAGRPYPLGKSGFFIDFKGEYPIWGPTKSMGPNYEFDNLDFAEGASLCDKTLTVWGKPSKPSFSWYYDARPK